MVRKALSTLVGTLVSLGIAALVSTSAHAASATTRGSEAKKVPSHAASHGKQPKRGSRHASKIEKTAEKRSERRQHAPKPSSEPLPTLAANMATPLAEPIGTRTRTRPERPEKLEPHAHGAEPARTPMTVSLVTRTSATTRERSGKHCFKDAIEIARGNEEEKIALTKCDGSASPIAVAEMSILVRPGGASKPTVPIGELAKGKGSEVAPGIKRIDAHLVERLQQVIDHFAKPGVTAKVTVVSGSRPAATGSFHSTGRALDFRIDGVKNEELAAFCKTMPDTGCGYYPNSSFVHLDVRNEGSGKVAWIDSSGPGEGPNYVASWPEPKEKVDAVASQDGGEISDSDVVHMLAKLDTEIRPFTKKPAGTVKGVAVQMKDPSDDDVNDEKKAPEDLPASLEAPIEDGKP